MKKRINKVNKQFKKNKNVQIAAVVVVAALIGLTGWLITRPNDATPSSNATNLAEGGLDLVEQKTEPQEESTVQDEAPVPSGPRENQAPSDPCPKGVLEGDRCVFTLEATKVPGRFTAYDQADQSLYGAATDFVFICHEADACEKLEGGGMIAQETTSRPDWKIVKPTRLTVKVKKSTPPYTFAGFRLRDEGGQPLCTSDHWYCYTVAADYVKN